MKRSNLSITPQLALTRSNSDPRGVDWGGGVASALEPPRVPLYSVPSTDRVVQPGVCLGGPPTAAAFSAFVFSRGARPVGGAVQLGLGAEPDSSSRSRRGRTAS